MLTLSDVVFVLLILTVPLVLWLIVPTAVTWGGRGPRATRRRASLGYAILAGALATAGALLGNRHLGGLAFIAAALGLLLLISGGRVSDRAKTWADWLIVALALLALVALASYLIGPGG